MGGSGAKHQSLSTIKTNSELLVRHKMRKISHGRGGWYQTFATLIPGSENCCHFKA
jgi:hypothetical protein